MKSLGVASQSIRSSPATYFILDPNGARIDARAIPDGGSPKVATEHSKSRLGNGCSTPRARCTPPFCR